MFVNHFFDCPSCNTKNKVSIDAEDRGQLQMKNGNEIGYTCSSCHKKEKIHINKIYAEPSKIVYIIAIIVSLFIIVFLWSIGIVIVLSFGLPMGIYLYQQSIARNFNNYKIRK